MADILLIEPDRVLAKTYSDALSKAGHQVVACSGAQSAIQSADQKQPDMVIIELQLIEHSGIEFLYEFRSYPEWKNIPVFIHTIVPPAEFSGNERLLKHELNINHRYLYKPQTSLKQLLRIVNEHLTVSV